LSLRHSVEYSVFITYICVVFNVIYNLLGLLLVSSPGGAAHHFLIQIVIAQTEDSESMSGHI